MVYQGPGSYNYGPPSYPVKNVPNAAPSCERQGCQLSKCAAIVETARQMIKQTGRNHMSQALWCDAGGHAYSERDPGRQRITVTVLDDETEEERQESRDFCGEHAAKAGLLDKRRTRPAVAEVTNGG